MSESDIEKTPRAEWGGWPVRAVLAGLIYLLGTGLVILLAPFSTAAQVSVLGHTLLGIVWLLPLVWYLVPHFKDRWRDKWSHLLLLGWAAGLLMLTVVLSGVVVTVQAAFGRRIGYGWDLVHIITGCAVGAIVIAHLLTAVRKSHKGEGAFVRRLVGWTSAAGIVLTAVTFAGGAIVDGPARRQALPEGYGQRYGDNPFAPSQARTDWLWRLEKDRMWLEFLEGVGKEPGSLASPKVASFLEVAERQYAADFTEHERGERFIDELGRLEVDKSRIDALRRIAAASDEAGLRDLTAQVRSHVAEAKEIFESQAGLPAESLAGSASCGTTGCHPEIEAEWAPSAHRYASRSAFFQLIQGAMAEANGAESTRYCAGCHDPISLFSGAKNIFHDDLSSHGADEGISCAVCHSIVQTDMYGNANYVVAPPERYLSEDSFVGQFLIRAYPRHHKKTYGRPLLETPEFCGACHKQFIDKELNRATRVQLQNQYDSWRGSHWFVPDEKNPQRADPEKSLQCRDCHMRLTESDDPAVVYDGKHRHHGYIASGQWLPILHDLPGAEKHVKLTEQWLRGETVIPEIADRWPSGPIVPLRIEAPESVKPGEKVKLRVIADNRKVGHNFPTGPLDVIQAWVEVTATIGGEVVFRSGDLDDKGFIRPGAWVLKAEGVDRTGTSIDRHNLWDMVGVRFKRVMFPRSSDSQAYTFECACNTSNGIEGTDVEFKAPAAGEELVVKAVLRYRKVDQALLNVLQPDGNARAPITDMSNAETRIRIDRTP